MSRPLEHRHYKQIEWNLHNVPKLRIADREATAAILYDTADKDPRVPMGASRHSDTTAKKAMLLLETEPHLWLDVISSTYSYYKNAPESRMAHLYYECKKPIDTVAEKMGCSRRMVTYYRDNFVLRCGMLALEEGLLKLSKRR